MSSTTRQDRALMRQRGAGARNVAKAEFGLDFGFSNDRQERQQMRQRGAASREIVNVDFGLSFPSSARSHRSTTRTPQPRRSASRQPSVPPAGKSRRSREPPTATTSRQTPSEAERQRTPVSASTEHSSKRRRISQSTETPAQEARIPALRSTRSSTRRQTRNSIFPIAEDGEAHEPLETVRYEVGAPRPRDDSPLFVPQGDAEKENDVPDSAVLAKITDRTASRRTSRRRTRSSILLEENGDSTHGVLEDETGRDGPLIEAGPSPEHQKGLDIEQPSVEGSTVGSATSPDLSLAPTAEEDGVRNQQLADSDVELDDANASNADYEIPPSQGTTGAVQSASRDDEAPIAPAKKARRKRKSVNLIRKKRSSTAQPNRLNQIEQSMTYDTSSQVRTSIPPSTPALSAQPTKNGSKTRRKAPTLDETPASPRRNPAHQEAAEEEEDNTYAPESSIEPETPAPPKRGPRKDRRQSGQTQGRDQPRQQKKSKATFPILTHRLTNTSKLPAIPEVGETDDESGEKDDTVGNTLVGADRGQVNAVDVLAQICRETIENMIERLSSNTNRDRRATLKTKRSALEAFGRDLDDELFDMSEALENRISLEARVRKSKRDKASLQAEWLEIRKERERIALRCDAVRRRNWESEADARRKWHLSEAARRAELESAQGVPEGEYTGTEFMLRSVVNEVSCASDRGGILERVRSFNAQLESLASFLESGA